MNIIKKLDQYLLANHPILWNMRLAILLPLLAISIAVFFILGFLLTQVTIGKPFGISDIYFYLVVFTAILVSILIFIVWLVGYAKHNALGSLYPRSTLSLYKEWLGTMLIIFLLFAIPISLFWGANFRISMVMSQSEYEHINKTLAMSRVLLPISIEEYRYKEDSKKPPLLVKNARVNRTQLDTKNFTYEQDNYDPANPIEYIGSSYLYAGIGTEDTYGYEDNTKLHQYTSEIQDMLRNGEKTKIKKVMEDYLQLHKKYNLKTNLNVEDWFAEVYNPPLFPVSQGVEFSGEENFQVYGKLFYTPFYDFKNLANTIEDRKNSVVNDWDFYCIILYFVLGLSLIVFTGRLNAGRNIIFAFIYLIVSWFIFGIYSSLISIFSFTNLHLLSGTLILLFWLVYLVTLGIYIFNKIRNNEKKGRSSILIHLAIWLIPSVMPFLYTFFCILVDIDNGWNNMRFLFNFNLLLCVVLMYPVAMMARRWKALPEE